VVILQEAVNPTSVTRIAELASMPHCGSHVGRSLGYLSRIPVTSALWSKPRFSRHAFLEVILEGTDFRIFGLHLSAVHAAWTERRRMFELGSLMAAIKAHQHGAHMLVGDFNTLAPGEGLDVKLLPNRLKALVWLSGGQIRFRTIQRILDAGYVDCYRKLQPTDPGYTFPTWGPHLRLDFAFVPAAHMGVVKSCTVLTPASAATASDHLPLFTEVSINA
jgi:endonuclease/exonuclease/phosphatase family metal-dependent hydrolase